MHANTPGVEVSQHFWPAAHATAWLQRPQCCGLCGRSHQLLEWFASGGQQNSLPVGHLSKQSLQSLVVPIRCGSPIVEPGLVQHLQPGFVPGASRLVPQLPQFSSVLSVVHTPTTVFVIGSRVGQQPWSGRQRVPQPPQQNGSWVGSQHRPRSLHGSVGPRHPHTQVLGSLIAPAMTVPPITHGFSAGVRHRHSHVFGSRMKSVETVVSKM